jgi:RimJ/RimL family protein N-acetyltransferase
VSDPPRLELADGFVLDGWTESDEPAHRRFSVDSDAARFLGWTVEQAEAAPDEHYEAVVHRFQREWRDGTRLSLALRERPGGEAIGAVELRPRGDEADVSYLVGAAWRGRGLAAQALDAFLAWGKAALGLRHATLEADVENPASQRVAEKCGFTLAERSGAARRSVTGAISRRARAARRAARPPAPPRVPARAPRPGPVRVPSAPATV